MNKKNLVKIINKELTILSDIVNDFSGNESIHPFEVDLALQKVKDIYGELLMLKDDKEAISAKVQQDLQQVTEKPAQVSPENITKPIEEQVLENEETVEEKVPIVDESLSIEPTPIEEPEMNNPEDSNAIIEVEEEKPDITIDEETKNEDESKEPEVISEINDETPAQEKQIPEETASVEDEMTEEEEEPAFTVEKFSHRETAEQPNEAAAPVVPEPKQEQQTADKPKTNGGIVADKFQSKNPSLNDMLAGIKQHKDLASSLKDRPIKDLKSAIKLNDRIWYTNELFKKDAALFEQTVALINGLPDLDAALAHVFTQFNWDQNKKSTISFLELVFRRFANN